MAVGGLGQVEHGAGGRLGDRAGAEVRLGDERRVGQDARRAERAVVAVQPLGAREPVARAR